MSEMSLYFFSLAVREGHLIKSSLASEDAYPYAVFSPIQLNPVGKFFCRHELLNWDHQARAEPMGRVVALQKCDL